MKYTLLKTFTPVHFCTPPLCTSALSINIIGIIDNSLVIEKKKKINKEKEKFESESFSCCVRTCGAIVKLWFHNLLNYINFYLNKTGVTHG